MVISVLLKLVMVLCYRLSFKRLYYKIISCLSCSLFLSKSLSIAFSILETLGIYEALSSAPTLPNVSKEACSGGVMGYCLFCVQVTLLNVLLGQ